jgi:hypothetical protein
MLFLRKALPTNHFKRGNVAGGWEHLQSGIHIYPNTRLSPRFLLKLVGESPSLSQPRAFPRLSDLGLIDAADIS